MAFGEINVAAPDPRAVPAIMRDERQRLRVMHDDQVKTVTVEMVEH